MEVCNLPFFFFFFVFLILTFFLTAVWFIFIFLLCIGHINHSLFWNNLAPVSSGGGKLTSGPLETAFNRDFGSVDEFKKIFNATTGSIQGSGWGWVVRFLCCFFYDMSESLYMCAYRFRDIISFLGNSKL